jgi:hypothetical protein
VDLGGVAPATGGALFFILAACIKMTSDPATRALISAGKSIPLCLPVRHNSKGTQGQQ